MTDIERVDRHRFGHEAISLHIAGIQNLYSQSNLRIHRDHQLFSLLCDAKEVASVWAKGSFSETEMDQLFSTLHIERIYNAVRFLDQEPNRNKYLKDLLKGSLNFFDRDKSHAKSILWELEVFTKIRKVIVSTSLEEPDVVVSMNQISIALPCKQIFSENGVPKVLSNAVSQIEKRHEFGIVAMNIDNLIPEKVLLKARTFQEAGDRLHAHNMEFLARHERHFLKYLTSSRIVAVLASTSLITDILDETPKFNNFSQWAIWTIPSLSDKYKLAMDEFRQMVIG